MDDPYIEIGWMFLGLWTVGSIVFVVWYCRALKRTTTPPAPAPTLPPQGGSRRRQRRQVDAPMPPST